VTPRWHFPEHHQKLIRDRTFESFNSRLRHSHSPGRESNYVECAALRVRLGHAGQDVNVLSSLVGEKFEKKQLCSHSTCDPSMRGSVCGPENGKLSVALAFAGSAIRRTPLVTGSQAMDSGRYMPACAVCRLSMTPSSPLLSFIADLKI